MNAADVFWSRVDKTNGGCWIWKGAIGTNGYGSVSFCGKTHKAHRRAYSISKGRIPPKMFVCHSCDVRLCCNPDHLWLGTARDNLMDAVRKGRFVPPMIVGEAHPSSKLTDQERIEMRRLSAEGMSYRKLAGRFGVSVPTAYYTCHQSKKKAKSRLQKLCAR